MASPHRSAAGSPLAATSAADRPPLQLQPSLLPPFEPLSSSPTALPKAASRKRGLSPTSRLADRRPYPTPMPTSSTALPTSSSPSRLDSAVGRRPPLHRTASTLSERAPLGELPTAHLPADGTPVLFGRSTNSSHFQLSSNRFISRIHVEAFYELPSDEFDQGRVMIKCLGWNGARVKYQGESHFLEKGHSCAFTNPHTELMLDVQDSRVILRWPPTRPARTMTDFSDASAVPSSPSRTPTAPLLQTDIPSSPPVGPMLHSPISPSPRRDALHAASDAAVSRTPGNGRNQVQVFEDSPSDKASREHACNGLGFGDTFRDLDGEEDMRNPTQSAASLALERASQNSSILSEAQDFSDNDEENDPVVHSFGPFGANLLPRLASLHAASPSAERRRAPLQLSDSANHSPSEHNQAVPDQPAAEDKPRINLSPIRNHVINQLAFSRVHSLPLGTIFTNLPSNWRDSTSVSPTDESSDAGAGPDAKTMAPPVTGFTREDLKRLLDETAAVGEIVREGKDAAGKALEDEFYYVPEMDTDTMRRNAVQTSLGKTGMRAVRKQHKQYYWKRPRY